MVLFGFFLVTTVYLAWEREFFIWVGGVLFFFNFYYRMLLYQNSSSFTSFAFFLHPSRNLCPPRQCVITHDEKLLQQEAQSAMWKAASRYVWKKAYINVS